MSAKANLTNKNTDRSHRRAEAPDNEKNRGGNDEHFSDGFRERLERCAYVSSVHHKAIEKV